MTFFDWKAQADDAEKRLRRHRRSRIILTQDMAESHLCGPGIRSWRRATETTESELTAMEVVRRTLAARPTLRGSDDVEQYERRIAEWSQWWCDELDAWITKLKRETRKRWLLGLIGLDRSPATESRTRTGPRVGLPGLPRHQRTQAAPRSQ